MTEGQDTESNIASETSKMEKEDPGTRGQSCRKGFFRRSFEFTGKLSTFNKNVSLPSSEVWFATSDYWLVISENVFSQSAGSCQSPSLLLWSPTQFLRLLSTTMTADFPWFLAFGWYLFIRKLLTLRIKWLLHVRCLIIQCKVLHITYIVNFIAPDFFRKMAHQRKILWLSRSPCCSKPWSNDNKAFHVFLKSKCPVFQ